MSEIKIQCPECHQAFEVPDELLGHEVECGSCNHPFTLSEDDIDKLAMRHFPGEKAAGLEVFSKKQPTASPAGEVHFQTASYDQHVDPTKVVPMGPRRILSIFIGISLMALVILAFVIGGGEKGVMTDVTADKRWVLAGFAALLGSLLIIFGFRKYRVVGVLLALTLAAAVCSMPILYPENLSPVGGALDGSEKTLERIPEESEENLLKYKRELGYAAVESRLAESEHPEKLIAVALMRTKPVHVDLIKGYLDEVLGGSGIPRIFLNRELNGLPTTLMIYQGVELPIEQAAGKMRKFGSVTKIRPDMRVVEVLVDIDALTATNTDVLSDESRTDFYRANLEELKHIDPTRQLDATRRLAKVEKIYLQADILRQLLVLFESETYPHKADTVAALNRWTNKDRKIEELLMADARKMAVQSKELPMSYLNFLVDQEVEDCGDILLYAWLTDRVLHESTLVSAGEVAQNALIEMMPELEPLQLQSAANVLRKIGTKEALPALLTAHEAASGDVKKSLKATIDEIKSRE